MYGDVNVNVEDGNLGGSTNSGTGIQVKIGVSEVEDSGLIQIKDTMSPNMIKVRLGESPLADACIDSVEWGATKIYCIPVKAATEGNLGELFHTGTGTGTMIIEGKPNNVYDIVIEIIESGHKNGGTFRYSVDRGNTFTEEMTIPLSGEIEVGVTGLTAKVTDAEGENSFQAGDIYTMHTTAPSMDNAGVIAAIEQLINTSVAFEFVHIVGTSGKALWAALASMANDFTTLHKRPLYFVCEARGIQAGETLDAYMAAMEQEQKGINSIYLQVVLSNATYQRKDGRVQDINMAGVVCGLYCQAKQSQSIGEVKSFPIRAAKLLKLLPDGIKNYIKPLDGFRYTTIRQYIGREDYYITSANMMSPEKSDFMYAEDVRVLNRLVKEVRSKALEELQTEIDPGAVEESTKIIEEELNIPIDIAIRDRVISSGRVSIDTNNLNILMDETMDVSVTYVPMGHVRTMNITFAVENPYMTS